MWNDQTWEQRELGSLSQNLIKRPLDSLKVDEWPPPIMKLADAQHHDKLLAIFFMDNSLDFNPTHIMKLHAILEKLHNMIVVDLKCQHQRTIESFFKCT